MSTSDAELLITKIVARVESAIELARHRLETETVDWRSNCYRNLATILETHKTSLQQGQLSTPGAGVGWGAGKAISEWGLDDAEISAAVEAAEGLYREGR
ncbi:hypothetical protein [Methylocystis iwaonis]|uniref:Uncharacterized protein n=1 Tax=Methylocystis iwaonis TaxID=2885079 RepID=A0ABM8EEP8_9HYPH|nr:hypothetical protein [Methylocystis iwaonis]BDV36426.1 hypothetical protein SS37A_39560 [Methylocystis iwaonis]